MEDLARFTVNLSVRAKNLDPEAVVMTIETLQLLWESVLRDLKTCRSKSVLPYCISCVQSREHSDRFCFEFQEEAWWMGKQSQSSPCCVLTLAQLYASSPSRRQVTTWVYEPLRVDTCVTQGNLVLKVTAKRVMCKANYVLIKITAGAAGDFPFLSKKWMVASRIKEGLWKV